jgi:hypothetical protein
MWTSEVNAAKDYASFGAEIGKVASVGTFRGDYTACCTKQELVECTLIKSEEIGEAAHSVKLLNCIVDIATWRAMLVACSTTGNTVKELCFSNVKITPQHIEDLSALLKFSDGIECVKLDYLTVVGDRDSFNVALKSLIANSPSLQYLSLKGNNLDDSFISATKVELRNHTSLTCLNLTENIIADAGVTELFDMLPLAICLNCIALKNNHFSGFTVVRGLENLLCGVPTSPEIDAELKAIGKIIGDKNKAIKDANKKRKKEGLPELSEVASPANRIVDKTTLLNRSIHTIDISRNGGFGIDDVRAMADVSGRLMTAAPLDATSQALTLVAHGLSDEEKEIFSTAAFNGIITVVC